MGASPRLSSSPDGDASLHSFDVLRVAQRLSEGNGGYEVVHETAGLQVGSTCSWRRSPIASSRTSGTRSASSSRAAGRSKVEGEEIPLAEGGAAFVKAGAEHRFVGYEASASW